MLPAVSWPQDLHTVPQPGLVSSVPSQLCVDRGEGSGVSSPPIPPSRTGCCPGAASPGLLQEPPVSQPPGGVCATGGGLVTQSWCCRTRSLFVTLFSCTSWPYPSCVSFRPHADLTQESPEARVEDGKTGLLPPRALLAPSGLCLGSGQPPHCPLPHTCGSSPAPTATQTSRTWFGSGHGHFLSLFPTPPSPPVFPLDLRVLLARESQGKDGGCHAAEASSPGVLAVLHFPR